MVAMAAILYFWSKRFQFFSSSEPKAQDELLWSLTIRHPSSVVRPSAHTFERLLPWTLGKFSSNFMWSLLLKGDGKSVEMVMARWVSWPPCPYMVKTLKTPEPGKLWGWNFLYNIGDSKSVYQVRSNDDRRSTFDVLRQGQICVPVHFVWGKYWKVSFSRCIKDLWLKLALFDKSSKPF